MCDSRQPANGAGSATKMTRRGALAKMQAMGTHVFYSPAFAVEVQEAFGMEPHTQNIRANTSDPKGLFVDDVGRNTLVAGYSSHQLSTAICRHLDLKVHGYYGRGSQQRADMEVIDAFLKERGE